MKVSILIPCLAEPTELLKVLQLQEYPENIELEIIRDNAKGISKARNNCIKNSKGDIVIFLDSDCYPKSTDWLNKMIKHTERYSVVVGRVVQTELNFIQKYLKYKKGFGGSFEPPYNEITPILNGFFPTTNCSIKRAILNKVGLFDENLFAAEDIDFNLRLVKIAQPYYIPHLDVNHTHANSVLHFLRKLYERRTHYLEYGNILRKKHNYNTLYKNAKLKMFLLPVFTVLLCIVPFVALFNRFKTLSLVIYFIESVGTWKGWLLKRRGENT